MLHPQFIGRPGLLILMSGWLAGSLAAGDELDWRTRDGRVSADIHSWSLKQTLEQVAGATGWEVYIEPGTRRKVSAKFKELPPGEALQRLLGRLNFALLPRTNAPAKLLVYRNSAGDATQALRANRAGRTVPNELIVTLKPGMKIDDLARQLGAKVTGRLGSLNAYRLHFEDEDATEAARKSLEDNSDVASVDSNFYMDRPDQPEFLGANATLPFSLSPKVATDGSGVIVGLVDTGLQPLDPKYAQFLLDALSVVEGSTASGTMPSHGTTMAETILQAMAGASTSSSLAVQLLPVDVYGDSATTTTFDVAYGISLVIDGGATIINLSLSGDGNSTLLETLIRNSSADGVLFIGAAGNVPVTTPTYPASYAEVLAVTAGDGQGNYAPYANYGAFVDVMAPGTSIVPYNGQNWAVSGTSSSAAYVTGVAAATAAQTGKSTSEVNALLRERMRIRTSTAP